MCHLKPAGRLHVPGIRSSSGLSTVHKGNRALAEVFSFFSQHILHKLSIFIIVFLDSIKGVRDWGYLIIVFGSHICLILQQLTDI